MPPFPSAGLRRKDLRSRFHPLGNNNQFHAFTPNSKASRLSWREHALVGKGFAKAQEITSPPSSAQSAATPLPSQGKRHLPILSRTAMASEACCCGAS
jgi:hypothetical protein